jgi:hypothetical protein
MPVEGNLIGNTAAGIMEQLEAVYFGDDESIVSEVIVIVAVERIEEGSDSGTVSIHCHASDPVPHHQIGLLKSAMMLAEGGLLDEGDD